MPSVSWALNSEILEKGRQWFENWGFQLEFDQLGEPKTRPKLEETGYQSFYTDKVPVTEMRKIGRTVKTSSLLANAERQFQARTYFP